MYEVDIIDRDVIDATVNLIEELVPLLLKETVLPIKLGTKIGEVVISVHDAFFWKKFRRLLENGDLSEDARAKFCGRLESEGEDKKKSVRVELSKL